MTTPIRSRGRRGSTTVPNWRWEDTTMDPHTLRVAGWLASHADQYMEAKVTRNSIAKFTGVSAGKVTAALTELERRGIIEIENRTEKVRLEIWFDHTVWESPNRSLDDQMSGHSVTTPGQEVTDTIGTDVEAQVQDPPNPPTTEVVVVEEWEGLFEQFYGRYPHKGGKPAAKRSFKTKFKAHGVAPIAAGFKIWYHYWHDAKTEQRFIPLPATWLNQERFLDDPPPLPSAPKKSLAEQAIDAIRNRDN